MTTPVVGFIHPSTRPLRVLVADDNCDCADSLAELLRLVGCTVGACYDGGAALALAERLRPDVCILDLWMPVLDGWDVAPRLRASAGDRPLLLIALTGLAGARAEADSLYAGFDHHILKPSDPNELYEDFAAFIRQIEPAVSQLV
jgi:CheY-like chemotaxis protein